MKEVLFTANVAAFGAPAKSSYRVMVKENGWVGVKKPGSPSFTPHHGLSPSQETRLRNIARAKGPNVRT